MKYRQFLRSELYESRPRTLAKYPLWLADCRCGFFPIRTAQQDSSTKRLGPVILTVLRVSTEYPTSILSQRSVHFVERGKTQGVNIEIRRVIFDGSYLYCTGRRLKYVGSLGPSIMLPILSAWFCGGGFADYEKGCVELYRTSVLAWLEPAIFSVCDMISTTLQT